MYHRSIEEVQGQGVFPGEAPQDRRHQAIMEVLRRLPPDAYAQYCDAFYSFWYFIPHEQQDGGCCPFTWTVDADLKDDVKAYAKVLYLSPRLERAAWDIIVATVVHELAHIILNHKLWNRPQEYNAQEEEVFRITCAWGFESETKKLQAVNRWRTSWEQGAVPRYEKRVSQKKKQSRS